MGNLVNKKMAQFQQGVDIEWLDNLPGEEYCQQNPNINVGIAMIIGSRPTQQDSFAVRWIDDSTLVAMVCDGMGGMEAGDLASKRAISFVLDGIEKSCSLKENLDSLFDVVARANRYIYELTDENGKQVKCGTTMTLALVSDNRLIWLSAGDSSIFYISSGKLKRVTKEHNYAFLIEMHNEDKSFCIDPDVRLDALVSYLGAPVLKYVDYNTIPWELKKNDMVILCSDGLTKRLSDKEIEAIVKKGKKDTAKRLVSAAIKKGGKYQDNTTVVSLTCKE